MFQRTSCLDIRTDLIYLKQTTGAREGRVRGRLTLYKIWDQDQQSDNADLRQNNVMLK